MNVTFNLSAFGLRLLRSLASSAGLDGPTGLSDNPNGGGGPAISPRNTVTVGDGQVTRSTVLLAGVSGDTVTIGNNYVRVRDEVGVRLADLPPDGVLRIDPEGLLGEGLDQYLDSLTRELLEALLAEQEGR